MDHADHLLPAAATAVQPGDPLGQAKEVAQTMSSGTALHALETAIAVVEGGGSLAAKAAAATALANESVKAAQYMECQLTAMDALLRMSQLVGR